MRTLCLLFLVFVLLLTFGYGQIIGVAFQVIGLLLFSLFASLFTVILFSLLLCGLVLVGVAIAERFERS